MFLDIILLFNMNGGFEEILFRCYKLSLHLGVCWLFNEQRWSASAGEGTGMAFDKLYLWRQTICLTLFRKVSIFNPVTQQLFAVRSSFFGKGVAIPIHTQDLQYIRRWLS